VFHSCVLYIHIGGNAFTGDLPSEIGQLLNLEEFKAIDNQLGGNIPTEFGNLASLEELRLCTFTAAKKPRPQKLLQFGYRV
jgi:hypothetical protein